MQYLKRNTKYSILAFLVIVLSITISNSTLAKTEAYFSLYDNPQILFTTSQKLVVQTINTSTVSQGEFIEILQISVPLARKIINVRDSQSGGFKEPKDFLQLSELTNFNWREWKEERMLILIK